MKNDLRITISLSKSPKQVFDAIKEVQDWWIGTEVEFTHRGLNPELECYESCSGGWDFYIKKSLKSYVETGKGLDPGF